MSDERDKPGGSAPPGPAAPARLGSVVPRTPDEGLQAALDALRPSARPERARRSPPPPSPERAKVAAPEAGSARAAEAADSAPAAATLAARTERTPAPAQGLPLPSRAAATDRGAWTAYRALPRRTPPELARPEHVFGRPDARARAELLEHLAERARGEARGRLLVAAAEAQARERGEAHARALYERAYAEGVRELPVLRELRKYALAERDIGRAAELLRLETELPLPAEERALALLALAEAERELGDLEAAERAALAADTCRPSVGSALALYALYAQAGRDREAAEQLERAAHAWPDERARAALLLLAARILQRTGDDEGAQRRYEQAHDADPKALDAALCWARAARKRGDTEGALAALERLEQALPDPALRAHARRARARVAIEGGHADLALAWLEAADDVPGLRLRARLAEARGDWPALRAALERRAELASSKERAFALLRLADLEFGRGEVEAAQSALERAAALDPSSLLVRTMLAATARARGGTAAGISQPPEGHDAELLEAAARAAIDASTPEQELSLLGSLKHARGTAAVIALDVAAELGRTSAVRDALDREAQQLSGVERAGLELVRDVLADRPGASRGGEFALSLLQDVYAADGPEAAGDAWLALSARASGELGACAAMLAGDYLGRVERAREGYERALTAAPGHAPSCHALEPILLARGDRPAARRLHAALSRNTRDPLERAARLWRAAQLADGEEAEAAWIAACRELSAVSPIDALLCDVELYPAAEPLRAAVADALESAWHGASGALADLAGLRAAALYERGGEPARAAVLYRELCDRGARGDAHAALGLERALADAGLGALLVQHLERAQQSASDEVRAETQERLALLHAASGDDLRAARSFRALLVERPDYLPALRALQRHAMRETDLGGLALACERIAARTTNPGERAAQLRLASRALALRGEPARAVLPRAAELGLWHAIEEERFARAEGDAQAIARAVLALAGLLEDAREAASYAMRAAEALEPEAPEQAAEALAPYAAQAPDHPLVYEALGRSRFAAGDARAAAMAYERAAQTAIVPARAARLHHRAALLWQETVRDPARARAALEAVIAIDPTYRDAFARLRRLLSDASEVPALAALLEQRAARGGDPREIAALHVERSRLLLGLAREPEARAALGLALELDPQREDALRAAAELDMLAGRHHDAVEALIQLARVSRDARVLRDAFFDLGRIYTQHLPDLRRAEIAFGRAVGLDDRDVEALEQLMRVFREKGEHDKALGVCERLLELAEDDDQRDLRSIEIAAIFEDAGDVLRAERALNMRREQCPASVPVLTALADLYARQNDSAALAVHLDRSAHALRLALVRTPSDATRWSALCALLARRGRDEAASHVAAYARDLGFGDAHIEQLSSQRPAPAPTLDAHTIDRLWPDELPPSARAFVRALEPLADALFGAPRTGRIERHSAELREAIANARRALAIGKLEVVTWSERGCIPLRKDPYLVALNQELLERCGREELTFLLTRAAATAQLGLLAAARGREEELQALVLAARSLELPADEAPDDDPKRAALQARLTQQLPPKRQSELQALAKRVDEGLPLRAIALGVGARVAFAARGALGAALRALSGCAPGPAGADYGARDLHELLEHDPEAQSLLFFALSDAFLDLRRAPESVRPGER